MGETKFLRPLFHALLALAVLQMLDVVLCIFEVSTPTSGQAESA